jgi:hypothetical protein
LEPLALEEFNYSQTVEEKAEAAIAAPIKIAPKLPKVTIEPVEPEPEPEPEPDNGIVRRRRRRSSASTTD